MSRGQHGRSRRSTIQAEEMCVQALSWKDSVQDTGGRVAWSTENKSKGGRSCSSKRASNGGSVGHREPLGLDLSTNREPLSGLHRGTTRSNVLFKNPALLQCQEETERREGEFGEANLIAVSIAYTRYDCGLTQNGSVGVERSGGRWGRNILLLAGL